MLTIMESVAWDASKSTGANISRADAPRLYYEAAAVSFYSARKVNPDAQLVLVTNTDVPADIRDVLLNAKVRIKNQAYDDFAFGMDVPWHLAYYKLCALKAICEDVKDGLICMLDTDTYIRRPLNGILREMDGKGIGLYDLHCSVSTPDRELMVQEAAALDIDAKRATCWGGEIICGHSKELLHFLDACRNVQLLMEERQSYSDRGDEFLLFIVGMLSQDVDIVRMNPYIRRIWTGRHFTPSRWEEAAILHLPSEKVYSFPRAYNRLAVGKELLDGWFESSSGLRQSRRPIDLRWMSKRTFDKVKERLL